MAAGNARWEPPILDLTVDRYSAFKAWNHRWTDYSIVTKLKDEDAEYRCSMLRYTFTEETRKIYNTLGLTADEEKDDKIIVKKLGDFAKGTVNESLERHIFYNRDQDEDEIFDDFLTDIKVLIKNCNFCATCVDGVVRDRIVEGIRDPSLRQKLLTDAELDLKKAEDACRAKEKAVKGAKIMSKEKKHDSTAEVEELSRRFSNSKPFQQQQWQQQGSRRGNYNSSSRRGNQRHPQTQNRSEGPPCKFCVRIHQWGRKISVLIGTKNVQHAV